MIIIVYGPDSFRALAKIREMKAKFIKDIDRLDTSFFEADGKTLSKADFSRLLATDSLFAAKRLGLIKNVMLNKQETFLSDLTVYLEALHSDNIIIFYEENLLLDKHKKICLQADKDKTKALTKAQQKLWQVFATGYLMYCPLPVGAELTKWIVAKVAANGLKISSGAERILSAAIGSDLWMMTNELDKLIAYKQNGEITEADVKLLVNHDLDQPIFDLTDAIGNRDKARAIKILHQQFEQGAEPLFLLAMLNRQFRIILSVRQGLDNGQSVKQLGEGLSLHPYVLQKSINQARNYTLSSLKGIISTLTKVDYNFKIGKLPIETMLDILIAKL